MELTLFISLLLLAATLLIVLPFRRHELAGEQESFGEYGENCVYKMLKDVAKRTGGYVYRNFAFMDDEGYSSEIDDILINQYGLFIIEVKSNKGTIYGNPNDEYWTAIKEEWQEDKTLRNPIKQNQGHINHLSRLAGRSLPRMDSLIIFPFGDIRKVEGKMVFDMSSAKRRLMGDNSKPRFKVEAVERYNKAIIKIKDRFGISHKEHVAAISKKYSN